MGVCQSSTNLKNKVQDPVKVQSERRNRQEVVGSDQRGPQHPKLPYNDRTVNREDSSTQKARNERAAREDRADNKPSKTLVEPQVVYLVQSNHITQKVPTLLNPEIDSTIFGRRVREDYTSSRKSKTQIHSQSQIGYLREYLKSQKPEKLGRMIAE